ncbi:MAG: DNA topoisomerase I [Magnetococcales bacterium]|nr:DNA topoisomerase I [Magnetococcales bacterium]|tara:strand:+ start:50266 stop:52671 length:2406 start_codon:yes stop_codon:yes gene_type:complete
MVKNLVIVESPGKIKKIQSYLGSNYIVLASVGHIMDLPPKTLGIDIENDFKPRYEVLSGKRDIVKKLKQAYKTADDVLIATDRDREGEMIGWNIAEVLGLKDPKRIVFDSITKTELLNAIKNPRKIDHNMVNAQKARRVLDRIVGYKLSPVLWRHVQKGLSAGRVQSVVVRLIVEKENEINNFFSMDIPSSFKFHGLFRESNEKFFKSELYILKKKDKDNRFVGGKSSIEGEREARKFLLTCMNSEFKIHDVFDKQSIRNSPAPFTTSTLQQEASRKLGFSVKTTMQTAQNLYNAGHITYMRTDATNLSKEAMGSIKKFINEKYGNKFYKETYYKPKSKNVQEAHEACRPSNVFVEFVKEEGAISNKEVRLYNLIWRRTIASQMAPAEFKITNIQISISKNSKYYFATVLENLVFEGYLKVYNMKAENEDEIENEENKGIKVPKKGTNLEVDKIVGKEEFKKPPSRFSEASLVDKLDPKNLNIGRPSTYATIISTIQDRNYAKFKDIEGVEKDSKQLCWNNKSKIDETSEKVIIGQEKNKLVPTSLGEVVNNFLTKNFPKIMDYKFTSNMEDSLDDIADNKKDWVNVMKNFYKEFSSQLDIVSKEPLLIEDKFTKILGKNEKGIEIIATMGKYGPMIKECETKTKCNIAPIKKPLTIDTITLEQAMKLLEYPKILGYIDKKTVSLKKGEYGFYVTIGKGKTQTKISIENENISLEDIKKILEERAKKSLGEFKKDTKTYLVLEGPYGAYIKMNDSKTKKKYNIKLPEKEDPKTLTLDKVLEIVDLYFKKPRYKKNNKSKKS